MIPEQILYEIIKIAIKDDIAHANSALKFLKIFGSLHSFTVHTTQRSTTHEVLKSFSKLLSFGSFWFQSILMRNQLDWSRFEDYFSHSLFKLFVEIARAVPSKLETMDANNCFDQFLSAFLTDDPLLQLNFIVVLKTFASFAEGRSFLQSKGIIVALMGSLSNFETNPLATVLLPGKMKFGLFW